MYAAPLIFVCLILCLCFSLHILHFNRVHNPTNGLSWILTCHQKGIQQQQSIYSIGELWLNSWVCGKQRDTSRMAFAVCVFLERSVWWERIWCSRRLWEERGGELGLGAAGTENRIGPLTDLVHWGIKELTVLLPTIDTTHPVKHIPPPNRITDKSPCLRSFFIV